MWKWPNYALLLKMGAMAVGAASCFVPFWWGRLMRQARKLWCRKTPRNFLWLLGAALYAPENRFMLRVKISGHPWVLMGPRQNMQVRLLRQACFSELASIALFMVKSFRLLTRTTPLPCVP